MRSGGCFGVRSKQPPDPCIFLLGLPPRALVLQVTGDVLAFDVSRHLAAEGATSSPLVPIGRPILGHQVLLLDGSQEAVQDDQVRIQIGAVPRGGFVRGGCMHPNPECIHQCAQVCSNCCELLAASQCEFSCDQPSLRN
jgi:hypothetical protein